MTGSVTEKNILEGSVTIWLMVPSSIIFFADVIFAVPDIGGGVRHNEGSLAVVLQGGGKIGNPQVVGIRHRFLFITCLFGGLGFILRNVVGVETGIVLHSLIHHFIHIERRVCHDIIQLASSMLSYISAGSVEINDGMYHVDDCMDIRECREIFAMIFKLMKQEQHYIKMCEPYKKEKLWRRFKMRISYNKLWKMLIDKGMNNHDLKEVSGVSSASIVKLGKGDNITTDVLLKICESLDCTLEDIMETVKD